MCVSSPSPYDCLSFRPLLTHLRRYFGVDLIYFRSCQTRFSPSMLEDSIKVRIPHYSYFQLLILALRPNSEDLGGPQPSNSKHASSLVLVANSNDVHTVVLWLLTLPMLRGPTKAMS